MIDPANRSATLLELLQWQVSLLDRLIEVGERQFQIIQEERMSELLSLLSEKQPLLTQLGDTANQIRSLNEQPLAYQGDGNADQSAILCRQLKDVAQRRFEHLFELEQKCESRLCVSRDQIAERLAMSSHSMTAIDAYQKATALPDKGPRLDLASD